MVAHYFILWITSVLPAERSLVSWHKLIGRARTQSISYPELIAKKDRMWKSEYIQGGREVGRSWCLLFLFIFLSIYQINFTWCFHDIVHLIFTSMKLTVGHWLIHSYMSLSAIVCDSYANFKYVFFKVVFIVSYFKSCTGLQDTTNPPQKTDPKRHTYIKI